MAGLTPEERRAVAFLTVLTDRRVVTPRVRDALAHGVEFLPVIEKAMGMGAMMAASDTITGLSDPDHADERELINPVAAFAATYEA